MSMIAAQQPAVAEAGLAGELAFADGEVWAALDFEERQRYLALARAAIAWGCDPPPGTSEDALDEAYEEGYEDCRVDVECAMGGGHGRRKRVAA